MNWKAKNLNLFILKTAQNCLDMATNNQEAAT